ncbi:MAG: glycosyltransferase [Flavobacteriaceae bacterium]
MPKFSIVITTKNRKDDLKFTLRSLRTIIERDDVELLICDDASTDGTKSFLQNNYSKHQLIFNNKSLGLIHNRSVLNNKASGQYIISLDDDANFLSKNPLEAIENHFINYPSCGLLSFRIFWSKQLPKSIITNEVSHRTNSFVGCGHAWTKTSWNAIPNYPAWFIFYGEEDFASYQLFKKDIEVHYLPKVLVHHRVDVKARKKEKDYTLRLRRSLRSGWYLYFLFFPLSIIPGRLLYTIWIQVKLKVFKGDLKALGAIFQGLFDVLLNSHNLIKNSNRFSKKELEAYYKLEATKIYWIPENE